jgi:hypothetical protein
MKAMIGRTLPLTPRPCMQEEAKNPMDGDISLFYNFLNASYEPLLYLCFL